MVDLERKVAKAFRPSMDKLESTVQRLNLAFMCFQPFRSKCHVISQKLDKLDSVVKALRKVSSGRVSQMGRRVDWTSAEEGTAYLQKCTAHFIRCEYQWCAKLLCLQTDW